MLPGQDPTLKPEELGEIPANVTTTAFTPQLEAPERTDFFLAHAGIGSVTEALYNGAPPVFPAGPGINRFSHPPVVKLGYLW